MPAPADPNAPQQPLDGTLVPPTDPSLAGTSPDATVTAGANPALEPPTREALAGSWNVPSDNAECRIILAFTKWSGGYRAATRRCTSPEIGTITAWDVKGQQVVLVDANGNTVARLYASAEERYDGTTNSGQRISFTR